MSILSKIKEYRKEKLLIKRILKNAFFLSHYNGFRTYEDDHLLVNCNGYTGVVYEKIEDKQLIVFQRKLNDSFLVEIFVFKKGCWIDYLNKTANALRIKKEIEDRKIEIENFTPIDDCHLYQNNLKK